MSNKNLQKRAEEILQIAEKYGVEQNFFFLTTFERYRVQLKILENLEQNIQENGNLITKEYVKGRQNLYSNPAVADFNRTTDSANKTVTTLMRIISTMRNHDNSEDSDPLLEILSGKNS